MLKARIDATKYPLVTITFMKFKEQKFTELIKKVWARGLHRGVSYIDSNNGIGRVSPDYETRLKHGIMGDEGHYLDVNLIIKYINKVFGNA